MSRHWSLSAVLAAALLALLTQGCQTGDDSWSQKMATLHPDWDKEKIAEIETSVQERIENNDIPGGVLRIHIESPYFTKRPKKADLYDRVVVFANKALQPDVEPNAEDTIYDLASLTKVVATAPSIMLLQERGLIDVDAPAAQYLPAFTNSAQKAITVRHLLTHTSGLRPGIGYQGWSGYDAGVATACKELPRQEPGTQFVYSDINFILLGEIVRTVSGKRIDEFTLENIYKPLGMLDTCYNPSVEKLDRIAPTQLTANRMLRGVVHDPTARTMDGVAGHAGVFSTVADLALYSNMLLHEGRYGKNLKQQLFKPETIRLMATTQSPPSLEAQRSLGWDVATGYSSPRGTIFPAGESFGHTGFTGTSMWILPKENTFYIFLSNRVHPDGKGNVLGLQRVLGTKIAELKNLFSEPQN
ncbi:MAG: serine hydrolase domain-containing protein [Limisphaerales bacterium]|nr:serine hydrolase domain-containing protein [Verrucomicrobiota bacterium]